MWSAQAEDGGWHSEHYGVMRSGQSLTPFVLSALLAVPKDLAPRPQGGVGRATKFLVGKLHTSGCLGLADPATVDYPTYATAMALQVLQQVGGHAEPCERMRQWLLAQQLRTGWRGDRPAFGAWGMGAAAQRRPPDAGHVDLSMNRAVLEALGPRQGARDPQLEAAMAASRVFLGRCQNPDGGFFFSPVLKELNKGASDGTRFASYGTTTADGILALLAVHPTSPKVDAAEKWLITHHRTDRVPGIPVNAPNGWSQGLIYYYRSVSAQVFARLDVEQAPPGRDWRADLFTTLAPLQRADGSFANPARAVKEDDPILATSLALQALVAARR